MDMKDNLCYKRKSLAVKQVNNVGDKKFLIDFIITTYLAPDVKSDNPRCSPLQRLISGLPPYELNDLGSSYVSISVLEKIYYYLLRNAPTELLLNLNMLHLYLKDKLLLPNSDFSEGSKQFGSFFPMDLHEQIWYPDSLRIIKGVVLIDDPVLSYIKEEDLSRFMFLTGAKTFKLDLNECLRVRIRPQSSKENDSDCMNKSSKENDSDCMNKVLESTPNGECPSRKSQQGCKRKYFDGDTSSMPEFSGVFAKNYTAKEDASPMKMCKSDEPVMMPLLSIPDNEDFVQDSSLILTGTAKKGRFGPSVGVVDIGISKSAYLFRVALPGVKKEYDQFSCDIESDGRVEIRGLLSGGRTITKKSRVYQMKTQQLCPPGPFTVSFSLPGPVDPRLFAPDFRTDGIFEGVIIKRTY